MSIQNDFVRLFVYKPIRHAVCAGTLGRVKPVYGVIQLKPTIAICHSLCKCACARDMSIRPIQVEVTNVSLSQTFPEASSETMKHCPPPFQNFFLDCQDKFRK